MKKLIVFLGMFLMFSCEDKPKEVKQNEVEIKTVNGLTYIISPGRSGIVNVTKDSLQMEYYKSQIEMNNKYFSNE